MTEVAAELGYAKSTVYRHLSTLAELGYVVKTDNEYRVGLRFLELGQHARTRQTGYDLTTKKVEEIAEQTGEWAQFIVKEHGDAVYIHRAFGDNAVWTDPGSGAGPPCTRRRERRSLQTSMRTNCSTLSNSLTSRVHRPHDNRPKGAPE